MFSHLFIVIIRAKLAYFPFPFKFKCSHFLNEIPNKINYCAAFYVKYWKFHNSERLRLKTLAIVEFSLPKELRFHMMICGLLTCKYFKRIQWQCAACVHFCEHKTLFAFLLHRTKFFCCFDNTAESSWNKIITGLNTGLLNLNSRYKCWDFYNLNSHEREISDLTLVWLLLLLLHRWCLWSELLEYSTILWFVG